MEESWRKEMVSNVFNLITSKTLKMEEGYYYGGKKNAWNGAMTFQIQREWVIRNI